MSELTKELVELVWGTKSSPGLSDTIFCRWTQGTLAGLSLPAPLPLSRERLAVTPLAPASTLACPALCLSSRARLRNWTFWKLCAYPGGRGRVGERLQLSSRDPKLLCPSLGCPSAGEEEGGRAALCDTEGVPSAVGSISQEVAWAPESFPPNKALLLVFGLIWREGSPQERQSG